jgi:hypothetical protein
VSANHERAARQRRASFVRDQPESAFAAILASLVKRTPGARAAALVDFEGETVDYAGPVEPYALKVAAAHWRIVYDVARAQPALPALSWIAAHATHESFVVRGLTADYAVVVLLARGAGLSAACRRAFDQCASDLRREAGWPAPLREGWTAVDVVSERKRPVALRRGADVDPLEVIGLFSQGLPGGAHGFRVRTGSGVEATLVREPGGHWYADEPLGQIELISTG